MFGGCCRGISHRTVAAVLALLTLALALVVLRDVTPPSSFRAAVSPARRRQFNAATSALFSAAAAAEPNARTPEAPLGAPTYGGVWRTSAGLHAVEAANSTARGPFHALPHLLFVPRSKMLPRRRTGAASVRIPLLVYLHGAGEIGRDLGMLLTRGPASGSIPTILAKPGGDVRWHAPHPLLNGMLPAIVLMPQTPVPWSSHGAVDAARALTIAVAGTTFVLGDCPAAESEGRERGSSNEAGCTTMVVDTARVVISGASNGGHGAFRLFKALLQGKPAVRPAAVVPVCGFLAPPADGEADGAADLCRLLLRGSPGGGSGDGGGDAVGGCGAATGLLMFHGANDMIVPPSASSRVHEVCTAVGLPHQCNYFNNTPTPDAEEHHGGVGDGHAAWRPAYAADSHLWKWLQQRFSDASSRSPR